MLLPSATSLSSCKYVDLRYMSDASRSVSRQLSECLRVLASLLSTVKNPREILLKALNSR
jgi:hypothetical protein